METDLKSCWYNAVGMYRRSLYRKCKTKGEIRFGELTKILKNPTINEYNDKIVILSFRQIKWSEHSDHFEPEIEVGWYVCNNIFVQLRLDYWTRRLYLTYFFDLLIFWIWVLAGHESDLRVPLTVLEFRVLKFRWDNIHVVMGLRNKQFRTRPALPRLKFQVFTNTYPIVKIWI